MHFFKSVRALHLGGAGGDGGGSWGQRPQLDRHLSMNSAPVHLLILSMNVLTSFEQYSGSLGRFASSQNSDGGGEGGEGDGGGGEGDGGDGDGDGGGGLGQRPQLAWQPLRVGSLLQFWILSSKVPACCWQKSTPSLSSHGSVALVVVTHARKIATSLPQKGGRDRGV